MRLTDIFETKYFIIDYVKDLSYFMQLAVNCLQDKNKVIISDRETVHSAIAEFREKGIIEIDLADARFVPQTIATLQRFTSDRVVLIDTMNITRDEMLAENRRRRNDDTVCVEIPKLTNINEIGKYFQELKTDCTYIINMRNEVAVPLATLIALFKPTVNIDISNICEELFIYINSLVNTEYETYGKYKYLLGTTYFTANVVNEKVYVPSEGYLTYDNFRKKYIIIPDCIGEIKLSTEPDFEILVKQSLNDLRSCLVEHRVTITDIYPRKE